MSDRFRPAWLPLVLLAVGALPAPAQQIKEMQFVNQPVNDILLALGEISGKSIIPDETVGGTASYHFAATDFDTALQVFLSTYKMYVRKQDSVYYVSRIRVDAEPASGTISMDAEDVEIPYLIRAASKALGRTILFDPLPGQPLTVHVTRMSPDKLLEIIVKRFPDYRVEADQDFYYVKRIPTTPPPGGRPGAESAGIERTGEQYSLRVDKGRFVDIVDSLFSKAKREYSLMSKKDVILDKLRFEAKPFERILRLLLEQANADYALIGDIYYIFEIEQRDVLKKLNTTVRIPLTYVSAKELPNLFPAELLSAQLFRIDAARNAVILSGSVEEIGPAQEFLRQVDRPIADRRYQVFRLSYLNAAKIAALLPPEYRNLEPIIIPESNSFVALMPEDIRQPFADYLALIDKPSSSVTVKLRYLKAEDLLKKLPSLAKEEILETGDPSVVFVRASPDKLADFYRELKVLDKPVPQIRYQILVIQYNKGDALSWKSSPGATTAASGATNSILAKLGNLNLSFDIVSAFGLQFALNLEAQLTTNDAQVRADTALVGLSGQDLEFRNTETFRYQEVEVDEKGNTIFTGVTREITSGLIFKVQGWVSGDQMITMNLKATVSKRGAASPTATGSPGIPPTSENIVNTLARTGSGQPVVIGGLMRQDTSVQVTKVPVLGHIPLLGYLFQSRIETLENSEIVIYIVPRVEFSESEETDPGLTLERLYQRFFGS